MRKRSGITVLELLIVTIVIALLATLAYIRYDDVREEAYVVAMMNDLRNYAIAQYEYRSSHGSWGTEEVIRDKTWFNYSKDVFPDTATAYSTADAFYLRVYHKKTNRYCELEVLSKDSISATHDRIQCPGKDSNESATEPTLAAPTITPPPGFSVFANETYDAVFIVHNNSSLTRTFQLSVQSSNPDVVPTPPNPSAVTIAGRSSWSVTIHFTVSGDAVAGMASTLSLHAVDVEAPELSGAASTDVVVEKAANMPPIATVICNPAEAHVGLVSTCELGGSDPDDDWPLTPSWPSCSPFMLTGPSCTFEQTVVLGTLTVRGYVTDSRGLASPIDSAQIVGTNTTPTASVLCDKSEASIGEVITCTLTGNDPDPHPNNDGIQPSWGSSLQTFTFEAPGPQSICGYVTDMHGAASAEDCVVVNVQERPAGPTNSLPEIVDINGVGLGCSSNGVGGYSVSVLFQAVASDPDQDPLTYSWSVEFVGPVPPGWSRPTPSSGNGPSPSFETHFSMTNVPESDMPSIMVWVTVHDNKGGSDDFMREFSPLRFCSGLGI